MIGNTFIRVSYEGTIYDLDVLEQTPIRLDISSIENDRIGEVFGAASQTFTLPSSRINNRFFKHAYKVGVEGVPGFGNSVDCWVISNSDTLLEGSLFLDEIIKLEDGSYNYNVTITNNVITFNENIKTTALKDLYWDDYDHAFSVYNITQSWDNNLFSGDIFYPLVDFGTDGIEPTSSVPIVDVFDGETPGYFDYVNTPLQPQQFSPAIRVSTVLDKIFNFGGFSYSSSLQPLFDSLYVLPRQTEKLGIEGTGFGDYGFIANSGIIVIQPNTSNTVVPYSGEEYDPTNAYNPITYTYTVGKPGSYVFAASIVFTGSTLVSSATIFCNIIATLGVNTRTIASGYIHLDSAQALEGTITLTSPSQTGGYLYFEQGEQVKVELSYESNDINNPPLTVIPFGQFNTIYTPINYETGVVNVGSQFDPQTKCIDFIKGLVEKFNLVIEPVYTETKTLKIETFDTWISSGEPKDWSSKLENAKRVAIKSPLSSQQKSIVFQDNKDNDKWSKIVQENAEGYQWGTEVVDAVSNIPQGEKKVGSYFAPIILEGMDNSSQNLIPKLYKFEKDVNKTFKHKPRLGYKLSDRDLGTTGYIGNNSGSFTKYATISNYDALPISASSTNNLHFNDTFYIPTFGTNNDPQTGSLTAYQTYWNNYINTLYNTSSIILSADFEFEPTELRDIALNNRIFVDDNWYRINKIKGYNVNNPDVTNVELISLGAGYQTISASCDFYYTVSDITTTTSTIGTTSTTLGTTSTSTQMTTSTSTQPSTSTSTQMTTSTSTQPSTSTSTQPSTSTSTLGTTSTTIGTTSTTIGTTSTTLGTTSTTIGTTSTTIGTTSSTTNAPINTCHGYEIKNYGGSNSYCTFTHCLDGKSYTFSVAPNGDGHYIVSKTTPILTGTAYFSQGPLSITPPAQGYDTGSYDKTRTQWVRFGTNVDVGVFQYYDANLCMPATASIFTNTTNVDRNIISGSLITFGLGNPPYYYTPVATTGSCP